MLASETRVATITLSDTRTAETDESGSLLGPWLSHCLIDAAIFLIGYDLVFTP